MDVEAVFMLVPCHTHPMEDLNTLRSPSLNCKLVSVHNSSCERTEWVEARKSGALEVYVHCYSADKNYNLALGVDEYDSVEG